MSEESKTKTKLLIVDDDQEFTELMNLNLVKRGFETCVINNPLNVLKGARDFEPDVILLDFIMREMDGGEVLSLLKKTPEINKIPVIMVSALASSESQEEDSGSESTLGESSVIPKPVDMDLLGRRIEEAIASA